MLTDIAAFVASVPGESAYGGAQERGAAWGVVLAPYATLADPHWRDRGFFVDVEHEELGRTITYPGAPCLLSATPWRLRRRASRLGEHTGEILRQDAGLTTADLLALAWAGVIALAAPHPSLLAVTWLFARWAGSPQQGSLVS